MLIQLLFFNMEHFALNVFTAFVFLAGGLLFLDSWQVDKTKKTPLFRGIGFFALALVAAFHASSLNFPAIETVAQLLKISGLGLILYSLYKEPILTKPDINLPQENFPVKLKKKNHRTRMALIFPLTLFTPFSVLIPLSAVLLSLIAWRYLKKSTLGLEKQLRPAFFAFLFIAFAEMIKISSIWANTTNVFLSKLVADYSLLWNIQHLFELVGIIILAVWIWGYIRFRLQIQLFTVTFASTLLIFLVTTLFFTFILLRNLENDALSHLKTDVNILRYTLDHLQFEALSDVKAIVSDNSLKQAFSKNDVTGLHKIATDFMLSQNTSFLDIASKSGEVIVRAEDQERSGDNIYNDPVVKNALSNNPLATMIINPGIIYPEVLIKAAAPIKDDKSGEISGAAVTGIRIDSAFTDGIKSVTGLDVAIFGGDKRAATTFVSPDGKSRLIGTSETNQKIVESVLTKGEIYTGALNVLNQPYYSVYAPLNTFGDKTIGMVFVGKPQTSLMEAAKKSINLTFLGSIILIVFSAIPTFFISRYIRENIEA